MLKASFSQAATLLSQEGRFLLIYSDLAANLKLQAVSRVEELCESHEMSVKARLAIPFIDLSSSPLQPYKSKSQVFLYDIRRKS
jgi:hypothetical protein